MVFLFHLRFGFQVSSVQLLSHVWLFATPWTAACQASLSITNSVVHSNSYPSSPWCHPTISSSVIPFSSHLQSFPAPGSFQMSQFFFSSGGQSIGVSASTQDWSSLGWTGWISLQSKRLSRVFSNTIGAVSKYLKNHARRNKTEKNSNKTPTSLRKKWKHNLGPKFQVRGKSWRRKC